MSSPALLTAPLSGILSAWGQLIEALHGVSGFGGNTAEVYAYLLSGRDPSAELAPDGHRYRAERDALAARAMAELLAMFCDEYSCRAVVDGVPFAGAMPHNGHRWHVRVEAS